MWLDFGGNVHAPAAIAVDLVFDVDEFQAIGQIFERQTTSIQGILHAVKDHFLTFFLRERIVLVARLVGRPDDDHDAICEGQSFQDRFQVCVVEGLEAADVDHRIIQILDCFGAWFQGKCCG